MIGAESIVVDNVTISLEKYIISLKIDENQNQRQFCPPPLVEHFINNLLFIYVLKVKI